QADALERLDAPVTGLEVADFEQRLARGGRQVAEAPRLAAAQADRFRGKRYDAVVEFAIFGAGLLAEQRIPVIGKSGRDAGPVFGLKHLARQGKGFFFLGPDMPLELVGVAAQALDEPGLVRQAPTLSQETAQSAQVFGPLAMLGLQGVQDGGGGLRGAPA